MIERLRRVGDTISTAPKPTTRPVLVERWVLPARVLQKSTTELENRPDARSGTSSTWPTFRSTTITRGSAEGWGSADATES